MNTIEVSVVARYLNWHYMTQGYHVGHLFQQSLGGSNSLIDKVVNLISSVSRVQGSIISSVSRVQGSIPASSIEINKSNTIDVSAVVIML